MICSAQEESPQRRKFNEDESCKILYCKSRKKYIKKSAGKGTKIIKNNKTRFETASTKEIHVGILSPF
jgi:hypothetical protein